MKQQQELTVITKCYDLVLWTVNHTSRFPRQHRHVLGDRIERHMYDIRSPRKKWRAAMFAKIAFQKGGGR